MTRTIQCPNCHIDLTIPEEAGSRRLRCPKCETRFFPPGAKPPAGDARAASSMIAQSSEQFLPEKKVKVPPSSGQHPTTGHGHADLPTVSGDLRDLLDISVLGDEPTIRPAKSSPAVADAASLFRDDPPAVRKKKPAAEARREARRCPSCTTVVPAGMSLCSRCGLDLDTGHRIQVDELLDEMPPPPPVVAPPLAVLIIGLIALVASLVLAVLSASQLEGFGRLCLVPSCLFGTYAAVQFLRAKSIRLLVVALMLGGVVDILVLIVLPVIQAETLAVPAVQVVEGFGPAPEPSPVAVPEEEETEDRAAKLGLKSRAERIDQTKMNTGIAVLIADALMLLALSTRGVKRHFERPRHTGPHDLMIP